VRAHLDGGLSGWLRDVEGGTEEVGTVLIEELGTVLLEELERLFLEQFVIAGVHG
jgi:3-keto-L-gulonate-6-phosphate decarboxylase